MAAQDLIRDTSIGAGGAYSTYDLTRGNFSGAIGDFVDPLNLRKYLKQQPAPDPLADQLVSMSQQDWDYYQNNIQPIQQQLLNSATSQQTIQKNVAQAGADVDTQFANLPKAFKEQMQGMGISITPQQQESFDRTSALNKGISESAAMNRARETTYGQQQRLLGIA